MLVLFLAEFRKLLRDLNKVTEPIPQATSQATPEKIVDANKSLWITTRRLIWGGWSSFVIVRGRQELAEPTVARESNNSLEHKKREVILS